MPSQGLVDRGVEDAPPVDAGKQGKHVKGHPNNTNSEKSDWKEGTNGVEESQRGWLEGEETPNINVKTHDTGKVVGDDGVTTKIKIHKDNKANIPE